MDPRRVDLSLLLLVDALLSEGSESRAARLLSLLQPAVSQGLKRARVTFGDLCSCGMAIDCCRPPARPHLPHVLVSPPAEGFEGAVDEALVRLGLRRQVIGILHNFMKLPTLLTYRGLVQEPFWSR